MAHKYEEQLQVINDSLQSTIDLMDSFGITDLNNIKIRITNVLKKEQYFIGSLTGKTRALAIEENKTEIKPLTHVFGKPLVINADKPVKAADTSPTPNEKSKFIAEVNDYYKNFMTMADEDLFNKANPLVIRAVAKRAGYAEYETAEINLDFIKNVRAAITAKNEEQKTLDTAKDKLNTKAK